MIIKGTVQTELAPSESWSPRGGVLRERRVQILHTDLPSWRETLQAGGYEYRYEPVGNSPVGIISYKETQSAVEDVSLVDTWAVRYMEEQRVIWADDMVSEQLAKITDETSRAMFKADIEAMVRGERTRQPDEVEAAAGAYQVALTFDTIVARSGLSGDDVFVAIARKLVADLGSGADTQFVSTPVLVRSTLRPATTTLRPVFRYLNTLCTTANLLAFETTIPANMAAEITEVFPDAYWLMKSPTMEQQEDGRWRYQREYWCFPRIAELQLDRVVVPTA